MKKFSNDIDLLDIADRNTVLSIDKEVRLEWSKISKTTNIMDKKIIIQGVRCTFKDVIIAM